MDVTSEITKIGLAAIVNGRLLVVRKRGNLSFILPGGKPEKGEAELETLSREVEEELGCALDDPLIYETHFKDQAADLPGTRVIVILYSGQLRGTPAPKAEIEELAWVDLLGPSHLPLAPSIVNHILPYLRQRAFI